MCNVWKALRSGYCGVQLTTDAITAVSPSATLRLHSVAKSSDSLRPQGLQPARLLCPWYFPGKNTGGGCHFLFQGILPAQGSNLCLLQWKADSWALSHPGSLYSRVYSLPFPTAFFFFFYILLCSWDLGVLVESVCVCFLILWCMSILIPRNRKGINSN